MANEEQDQAAWKAGCQILEKKLAAFPLELRFIIALVNLSASTESRRRVEVFLSQPIDWRLFSFWLDRHGLVPLVYKNIRKLGIDCVPEKTLRQLKVHTLLTSTRALLQTDEIIRVTNLLSEQGVPSLIMKGTILSQKLHKELSIRQVGDIDLLVPEKQIFDAHTALVEDGYRLQEAYADMTSEQLRAFVVEGHHFGYEQSWDLEIHWKPPWIEGEQLQGTVPERLWTDSLKTFPAEEQFLHLCKHGAEHGWSSLKWLADIHQVLRNPSSLNWSRFWDLSGKEHAQAKVLQAMLFAKALFNSPVPDEVYSKYAGKPLRSRLLHTPCQYIVIQDENCGRPFKILYLASFENGLGRIFYILRRFKPQRSDKEMLPLPAGMFPLYYLLRPGLWLLRQLKRSFG